MIAIAALPGEAHAQNLVRIALHVALDRAGMLVEAEHQLLAARDRRRHILGCLGKRRRGETEQRRNDSQQES